ncbi:hypothetical protein HK097_006804 [Rhizophlyctis rosea]|uniref:Poly [ADP-ribose] polymerase n=1 Tax=Rhizophlyctis rosea TaxID=64517 RepID=A0AAD5SCE1_9FUNG|nr:hypothetical protein HK097_006804 [Rhizophlyctis rosea]
MTTPVKFRSGSEYLRQATTLKTASHCLSLKSLTTNFDIQTGTEKQRKMVGTRSSARLAAAKEDKKKRVAENDEDTEVDSAGPSTTQKRTATKPPTKRARKAKEPAPASADETESTNVDVPKVPKEVNAPAKKGRARTKKAVVGEQQDEDGDVKMEEAEEDNKKGKKGKKGDTSNVNALVDPSCPLIGSHRVYKSRGVIYDATLNQTNIGQNNNKYYYIQLLETKPEVQQHITYAVWTHWGRVGENGQNGLFDNLDLEGALAKFEEKFKAKTALTWSQRHQDPRNNKYTFIERDYEESDEPTPSKTSPSKTKKEPFTSAETETCTLSPEIQSLLSLIFSKTVMQNTLASLKYDSNKLPLGKLSKNTIRKGFTALKALAEVIEDPKKAQEEHGADYLSVLKSLTSQYYTVIPHVFGRTQPPVINNVEMVKMEVELIESLGDMEIATELMEAAITKEDEDGGKKPHPLDQQYAGLNLEEMTLVDPKSTEYKHLSLYLQKTHGPTHTTPLEIEQIFRITRLKEEERYSAGRFDAFEEERDDRRLLWHASRVSNFGGILSQGLRIAPPEAPVTGYDYGKGVYFADMVSKSCGYCCHGLSNNTGLLLLCEVQLGNPQYESWPLDPAAASHAKQANALATRAPGQTQPVKWMDAGVVNKKLSGVQMPETKGNPLKAIKPPKKTRSSFEKYTEYIVYNVAQIQMRYLFRCKFDPKDTHYD